MNRGALGGIGGICKDRSHYLNAKIKNLDSRRKDDFETKGFMNVLIESEKEILNEIEFLFSLLSTVIDNILAEDQNNRKKGGRK